MISNQQLIDILNDWHPSNAPALPHYCQRQIKLPSRLYPNLVFIIQGVRRGGKSTLLSQLPAYYQIAMNQCFYCNFEDPRLIGSLTHELLSQIANIARSRHPAETSVYFFFDEIQLVEGWEKWLHVQLERPRQNHFIVTGSNSALLSGEFGTALTGRHMTMELFPFSWMEFQTLFPQKNLNDYLAIGGFPAVLTYEEPYKLLQEYFNDIILRDVLKRVHSRTPDAIKQVVKMAFDTCGSELSYRKIAAVTGLTVDTVKTYLEACEQAYLLFGCSFFAFSEKKRLSKQKKYYPIDTGLRHAVAGTSGRDQGKSLECLIFLHLKQRYQEVFYWQETNLGEVDFVVMDGQQILPYQITLQGPEPRHHRALENFYKIFPQAKEAVFITADNLALFLTSARKH